MPDPLVSSRGQSRTQRLDEPPRAAGRSLRLSFRLGAELGDYLRRRREETGTTLSELVRAALRTAIARSEHAERVFARRGNHDAPQDATIGAIGDAYGPEAGHLRPQAAVKNVPPAVTEAQGRESTPRAANSALSVELPRQFAPLVAEMRHFGALAWSERRRSFIKFIAVSQACCDIAHEPRDIEALADFIALGRKHGLFVS